MHPLKEALNQTVINEAEYNMAIAEAGKIVHSIEAETNILIQKADFYFEMMKQHLNQKI